MDANTRCLRATSMHSRLLSFISDFERALLADDPSPDEGTWQNERAVNYRTGLARVQLVVLMPDGQRKPLHDPPLGGVDTVALRRFCVLFVYGVRRL